MSLVFQTRTASCTDPTPVFKCMELQWYSRLRTWMPAGLQIQTSTPSRNFITEQTSAPFPYWDPPLVCSPSMLLFRQRMAALQPSAPHTSFLFLSPCPPSQFLSLRIKGTQSGWPIHWALSTPTRRNHGLHPPFRWFWVAFQAELLLKVQFPVTCWKLYIGPLNSSLSQIYVYWLDQGLLSSSMSIY